MFTSRSMFQAPHSHSNRWWSPKIPSGMPHHGPARVFESRLGETTQARSHLSFTNLEDVLGACTYRSRSLPPSCRTVWTSILQACKETMRKACESLLPPRRDRSLLQSQKPRAAQMTRPAWSNVPRLPESFDECCFASTGVVYLGLHHTLPLCARSWRITFMRTSQYATVGCPSCIRAESAANISLLATSLSSN